jgi:hypothetical protein
MMQHTKHPPAYLLREVEPDEVSSLRVVEGAAGQELLQRLTQGSTTLSQSRTDLLEQLLLEQTQLNAAVSNTCSIAARNHSPIHNCPASFTSPPNYTLSQVLS